MKRFIVLFLILALILSLCACAAAGSPGETGAPIQTDGLQAGRRYIQRCQLW